MKEELIERETSSHIIGAFYDVYNELGFGFLEHVYSLALERELVGRTGAAVSEFVAKHTTPRVTERLNAVYATQASKADAAAKKSGRRTLGRSEW